MTVSDNDALNHAGAIIEIAERLNKRHLILMSPKRKNVQIDPSIMKHYQGIVSLTKFILRFSESISQIPAEALANMHENFQGLFQRLENWYRIHYTGELSITSAETKTTTQVELNHAIETVLISFSPWLSYITLVSTGFSSENEIKSKIQELNDLVLNSTTQLAAAKNQFDLILEKAKETAGGVAASQYAIAFEMEARRLKLPTFFWLLATLFCATLTIAVAFMTWYCRFPYLDTGEIIQLITSKLIALSVLISATIWCGRMYKTLMNQIVLNRFRSLGLTTFQAFYAAGADTLTKNAVLLETTKSIFSQPPTGLIEADAANSSNVTNIVELAKAITDKA